MNPEQQLIDRELEQMVNQLVLELGSRWGTVIRLRYGFDGPSMKLREVAEQVGLTTERVRQIQIKAERKLRRMRQLERLATVTDRAQRAMDIRRAEMDREAEAAQAEQERVLCERKAIFEERREQEMIFNHTRAWWTGYMEGLSRLPSGEYNKMTHQLAMQCSGQS